MLNVNVAKLQKKHTKNEAQADRKNQLNLRGKQIKDT